VVTASNLYPKLYPTGSTSHHEGATARMLRNNSRLVNAEVIPAALAAFSRGQNGLRTAVSAKLNLLKKTTFYNLRVSQFTSALSLVRGETVQRSEVNDRRDRSNELYEQVAALA
jgi:hypothetical protein